MPKVSIIIPAYNVNKKYMRACIDSVLNQTYKDIEVIIVDDGSSIDCAEFCDKFAEHDSRVKVIHQGNQGVSVARNNGTNFAMGDYIMYVDADDIVVPFMIESAVCCAKKYNADLVFGLVKRIYDYSELESSRKDEGYFLCADDKKEELKRKISTSNLEQDKLFNIEWEGIISRGPYVKLIKREIAEATIFPTGIIYGEDLVWTLRLINNCNKLYIINEVWYGYLQYRQSSVYRYNEKRLESSKLLIDIIYKENEKFIKMNPKVILELFYIEMIILIRYHFLTKECKLSGVKKIRQLNAFIDFFNNIVCVKKNNLYYVKVLFMECICKSGLWIPLFSIWGFLKRLLAER